MTRTFICVPVPDGVKRQVAAFQHRLKECRSNIKWVDPGNLHITIKFLGDVENHRIADIAAATAEAVSGIDPFSVELCGAGAFPNLGRPRVLWVGIGQGAKRFNTISEAVNRSLEGMGFERDSRKFSGHVTIGRIRTYSNIDCIARLLEQEDFCAPVFQAACLYVMKSVLTQRGPVYSPLNTIKL